MQFDIHKTIQSQYACSPHIRALILGYYRLIDPTNEIRLFYKSYIDIDTAVGVGLDNWGRIVNINRNINTVTERGYDYFGFPNAPYSNKRARGFGQAPFFTGAQDTLYELSDDAYRLLIKTKAMANISTGSLADLNRMLSMLLPDVEVKVYRTAPMHLKIECIGDITDYEKNILETGDLPPIPTGVTVEFEYHSARPFGFDGGNTTPFDQGPFVRITH